MIILMNYHFRFIYFIVLLFCLTSDVSAWGANGDPYCNYALNKNMVSKQQTGAEVFAERSMGNNNRIVDVETGDGFRHSGSLSEKLIDSNKTSLWWGVRKLFPGWKSVRPQPSAPLENVVTADGIVVVPLGQDLLIYASNVAPAPADPTRFQQESDRFCASLSNCGATVLGCANSVITCPCKFYNRLHICYNNADCAFRCLPRMNPIFFQDRKIMLAGAIWMTGWAAFFAGIGLEVDAVRHGVVQHPATCHDRDGPYPCYTYTGGNAHYVYEYQWGEVLMSIGGFVAFAPVLLCLIGYFQRR